MSGSKRIVVLGAGRVGSLIARDLAAGGEFAVRAVDRRPAALDRLATAAVETRAIDLADPSAIRGATGDADVVVGAVPGAVGFRTLQEVLSAGKHVVDISFMPEDPSGLDELARQRGACAVVDCGVAPGISNWLIGRSCAELDEVEDVEIYVGGLPFKRHWPFEYRAVFSPSDVIEEYTRPCRLRENGLDRTVPALSGIEHLDFDEVGTLEAFYTDGLRTLLSTIPARTLREKTLRYPGHAEKMLLLRESGFFDTEALALDDGSEVVPRRLTYALLSRAWALRSDDEEFTVLRVVVRGRVGGRDRSTSWDLFDRTDAATGMTSMARTTGYPAAIVARLLARGTWKTPGIWPPESLGRDEALTRHLLDELARRGVRIRSRSVDDPVSSHSSLE